MNLYRGGSLQATLLGSWESQAGEAERAQPNQAGLSGGRMADRYQAHQRPPQGVPPCKDPSHGPIPPRAGNAPATDNAAPSLGRAARRAPAASPADAQSGRHAAASAARRQGGEA